MLLPGWTEQDATCGEGALAAPATALAKLFCIRKDFSLVLLVLAKSMPDAIF